MRSRRSGAVLRRIIEWRLAWHVFVLFVVSVGLVASVRLPAGIAPPTPPEPHPGVPSTQVDVLLLEHGCWTGKAPLESGEPEHAVVQLPGRRAELVPARVGFEIWLGPDGVPRTGDERDGLVFGFCR